MDHGLPLDPKDEDEDDAEDVLLELELRPSDRGGVWSVTGAGAVEPGPCAW